MFRPLQDGFGYHQTNEAFPLWSYVVDMNR